jgi:hypothetical protein
MLINASDLMCLWPWPSLSVAQAQHQGRMYSQSTARPNFLESLSQ